jgi:hypothetical protein
VKKTLEERFWEKVDKTGACWWWVSHIGYRGYGTFWVGGRKRWKYAHRLSWELANDQEVPDGMVVMHSCDNPACVNPDHLSVGCQKDNKQDCVNKLRQAYGVKNGGGVKLDDQKAAEIMCLKGKLGSTTVGRRYGVSKGIILKIWHGRLWKHVQQSPGT